MEREDSPITVSVEGREPEPVAAVLPRLTTLIEELSAIPGVRARIDITVTVTFDIDLETNSGT